MSATPKLPRRQFRARRRGPDLYLGREPLPAVAAFVEQHRARLMRPGVVTELLIWHDAECRYPQGEGPCVCRNGPEIRVKGEDPERN